MILQKHFAATPDTYLYDDDAIRYKLVQTNPNTINYNWLFVPGGPGADSSYFLDLINSLDMPGNYWLIDFPANGNNFSESVPADYDFEKWQKHLMTVIQKFEKPIYVGHAFGGMFPLLFPMLEKWLQGFILISGAPTLWLTAAEQHANANNILPATAARNNFRNNPSQETFKTALLENAHYYFPAHSLEKGKKLLEQLPFNYHATRWWINKIYDLPFRATWVPQDIPTLIINGTHDFIIPYKLFEDSLRFQRNNITIKR